MERTKENAYNHMMQVFAYSWTWERLTDTEREAFRLASVRAHLRGNYEQRCEQMNDLYHAFLMDCGYSAIGWREEKEEAKQMSKARKIYFVWGRTNAPKAAKIKIIACSTLKAAKSFVNLNDRYYRDLKISEVIAE